MNEYIYTYRMNEYIYTYRMNEYMNILYTYIYVQHVDITNIINFTKTHIYFSNNAHIIKLILWYIILYGMQDL